MKKYLFLLSFLVFIPLSAKADAADFYNTTVYTGYFPLPWTPAYLDHVVMWIDGSNAGSVTYDVATSSISQIIDLSGHNDTALQNTGSHRPLYIQNFLNGMNVFKLFNGIDFAFMQFQNNEPGGTQFSVAFLGDLLDCNNGNTNFAMELSDLAASNGIGVLNSCTMFAVFNIGGGIETDSAVPIAINTWNVYVITYDGANLKLFINNVDQSDVFSDEVGSLTKTSAFLSYPASGAWHGYIAEMVFTDIYMGPYERTKLYNYWKDKWGL